MTYVDSDTANVLIFKIVYNAFDQKIELQIVNCINYLAEKALNLLTCRD